MHEASTLIQVEVFVNIGKNTAEDKFLLIKKCILSNQMKKSSILLL